MVLPGSTAAANMQQSIIQAQLQILKDLVHTLSTTRCLGASWRFLPVAPPAHAAGVRPYTALNFRFR